MLRLLVLYSVECSAPIAEALNVRQVSGSGPTFCEAFWPPLISSQQYSLKDPCRALKGFSLMGLFLKGLVNPPPKAFVLKSEKTPSAADSYF